MVVYINWIIVGATLKTINDSIVHCIRPSDNMVYLDLMYIVEEFPWWEYRVSVPIRGAKMVGV